MGATDLIRQYSVKAYVQPARASGQQRFEIVAGAVHKGLRLSNRVPLVCQALKSEKFLNENGLAIEKTEGPPSGLGTRVVYTYRFKDAQAGRPQVPPTWGFAGLRGIAKQVFADLGGGEAFIRSQREDFGSIADGDLEHE